MHKEVSYRWYVLSLTALFGVIWALLAISPVKRGDWLMENLLVIAFVITLMASHRHFLFSRTSFTLVFLFLCIHEVGAHYTYAQVPYNAWWHALTGQSLDEAMGFQRNQFDRLVHFSYGFLLAYPIREGLLRFVPVRGFLSYFLALNLILSSSAVYELIEWIGGAYLGGDTAKAFIGAQQDPWDAQKDMAMATLGATLILLSAAAVNAYRHRDAALEWANRFKQPYRLSLS
ncbi:putative membrane protein [Pseudomonas duriflava]|uniref:Putative membrane protein n=1 Tax=Pseudomonas duriflava TaxID=459528 RepID=A0A562PXQ0_9PSED|nr:DUF2238 domain-containing protein [Pseudomonas duriflava]TWI49232.1 putative membrane protein [Pseudomonas duriflava]